MRECKCRGSSSGAHESCSVGCVFPFEKHLVGWGGVGWGGVGWGGVGWGGVGWGGVGWGGVGWGKLLTCVKNRQIILFFFYPPVITPNPTLLVGVSLHTLLCRTS